MRRHLLTVVAGGAFSAVIPAATLTAAPAVDPIFAAIELHREAGAAHDAAVNVRAHFNDVNMNDEQKKQLDFLADAVDGAWDRLDDVGCELLNTMPATLAGIAALCRYVEPLFNERETMNLPETICWDDETESSAAGAFANMIAAAVKALIEAQAGKAVRS